MIWALRRQVLTRQLRQSWKSWRGSGLLLMGGYLAAFALVLLISAWQSYRVPLGAPDPLLAAALAGAGWLSAWLPGRPAFGLAPSDEVLLRAPLVPWTVLLWPLLARLLPLLGVGAVAGLALGLWWPAWWPYALALPLLAAGRPLLQSVLHDARLRGARLTLWTAGGLGLLPLLGAIHPLLLPLGAGAGVLGLALLWSDLWRGAVPPRALTRWRVEALRQSGQRLGLPPLDLGPDGAPPERWWMPELRGRGPWAAALWHSALHLSRRRRWLLLALGTLPLLGAGVVFLTAPPAGLDPLLMRGLPLVLAQLWAPFLDRLGPELPGALPLAGSLKNLARVLPAGALFGVLVGVGAVLSAAGWGTVLAACALPGTALSLRIWLGRAAPGGLSSEASVRLSAAAFPTLLVVLCGGTWSGWLAPLLLLGIAGAALWGSRA